MGSFVRIVFSSLQPNRLLPRNPLLRALLLAVGALILAGLLFFGLIAGAALLAFGAVTLLVRRLLPSRSRSSAGNVHGDGIIEGEFKVVEPSRAPLPRAENY